MSVTAPRAPVQERTIPDTRTPTTIPPQRDRGILGWLVLAVALVATAVLAFMVLNAGPQSTEELHPFITQNGGITAIDNATESLDAGTDATAPPAPAVDQGTDLHPFITQNGGIRAVDGGDG
jgi:hypothetical protein